MLEAAGRHGAAVVFSSTGGALCGDEAPIPTPEDRIPAPLAPYGASKWAGEAYVTTWARSGGLAHAVCRFGNVYGPRQSPHGEAGVVSIFTFKLWRGETPVLFGHSPTRDYVHVADVVDCMLRASGVQGVFNARAQLHGSVARAQRAGLGGEGAPGRGSRVDLPRVDRADVVMLGRADVQRAVAIEERRRPAHSTAGRCSARNAWKYFTSMWLMTRWTSSTTP